MELGEGRVGDGSTQRRPVSRGLDTEENFIVVDRALFGLRKLCELPPEVSLLLLRLLLRLARARFALRQLGHQLCGAASPILVGWEPRGQGWLQ